VALEGALAGKTGAVVLINAQTYSYDCLDGLLRVPLVRSVPYAHHDPAVLAPDPARPLLDQGWQERRFWVLGGHGTYTDFLPHRRAEEAQTPAEYVMDSAHPGTESWEHSFLTVLPDQVAVTAFKQAEDGDGMILRLQEMHGAHTDAHLTAPGWRLDYHTPMTPWAIRTFRLRRDSDVLRVDDNDLLEGNV
jgi:alpha-mannosidase